MIGIAISCYNGHLSQLFDLFDSIQTQTILPDKVIVSCSSTDENTQKIMNRALQKYNFSFKIIYHLTYKNAAENRNIAVSYLTDMDYITFIDADDIMHYQRIEILLRTFNDHDCDIILHNYSNEPLDNITYPTIYYKINGLRISNSYCIEHINNNNNNECIHHSQSSIKKYIIEKVKFRESIEYNRREDSFFCSDIFKLDNIKNVYISNKLTYYRQSNTNF